MEIIANFTVGELQFKDANDLRLAINFEQASTDHQA